jgi:hypothetical protein
VFVLSRDFRSSLIARPFRRCFVSGRRDVSHRRTLVVVLSHLVGDLFPTEVRRLPISLVALPIYPSREVNFFCAKFRRYMTNLFFFSFLFFLFLFFGYLKIPFSSPHSEEKNMGVAIFKHWVLGDRQNIARFSKMSIALSDL